MNKNLDKIAEELFNKIRSQISNIQLADGETKLVSVPSQARFFSFNYSPNGESLGSVTITLDETDGLIIMYSNDIVDSQTDGIHRQWFKFLQGLRDFSKRRFLNFEARDILKSLDKKDYEFLSKNRGDDQMSESKLWGTSKTSYQTVGESRIIVKHHKPVNVESPQGRTQNIDSIYIENTSGERFKYPVKHLNGARAMGRHVANGGNPYDGVGSYICGLSEELAKLKMFKGYVDRNPVISESMDDINTKVIDRINTVKKQFQQLQTQTHYSQFVESFKQNDSIEIPEEIMNDWIDRLTVRSFNEELKKVFPYIYNLVEAPIKELTPSDILTDEEPIIEHTTIDSVNIDLVEYEQYLDSLIEEVDIFNSDDEALMDQLNQLMADVLPVGADGANAIESITGLINDPELNDVLKELSDISPESDARGIIHDYIKMHDEENGTDILSKLEFSDKDQEEQPAPSQSPAIADSINRAITAGAKLDDKITETATLKDAIIRAGYKVEDFFNSPEDKSNTEIVEYVKSMYDRHTGKFPKGETGVVLSVEKQFGKPATKVAVETIKNLRTVYETARMQKLAGM
jgi:hypothetical protein